MQRIDTPDNLFDPGDPNTGTKGTMVSAAWLNAVQEEIAKAIEIFGVALDSGDNAQLSKLLGAFSSRPGDAIFLFHEPSVDELLERRILMGNGGSVLDADYPSILNAWGAKLYGSPDATHFYLPPLCGYFPRFWDNGTGVDPDAATRSDRGDGTLGDTVGTRQMDEFKLHHHTFDTYVTENIGDGARYGTTDGSHSVSTRDTGGNETRPKNIYIWGGVYY